MTFLPHVDGRGGSIECKSNRIRWLLAGFAGSLRQGVCMTRFDDATAVKRIAQGHYEADLDAAFGFAEALNGGYLMAVLLRAALDASPHAHPVATSANFLRVGKPGPADIWVESRKSGRTAATA